MNKIENNSGIYVEITKDDVEFAGNTEEERKMNELIYDLSLENDALTQEVKELHNTLDSIKDYVNYLVIYNQTINGKFSDTPWGQDILSLIDGD